MDREEVGVTPTGAEVNLGTLESNRVGRASSGTAGRCDLSS